MQGHNQVHEVPNWYKTILNVVGGMDNKNVEPH